MSNRYAQFRIEKEVRRKRSNKNLSRRVCSLRTHSIKIFPKNRHRHKCEIDTASPSQSPTVEWKKNSLSIRDPL